jgi:hypothetical protein
MKTLNIRRFAFLPLAGMLALAAGAPPEEAVKPAKPQAPLIQMAILLDTSNSMDGLIDQAKSQLWKIVNELARMKRGGATADLRVALYEYGKSSLPRGEGYIRMIAPLTADLDKISEDLFALRTNGGDEYCGQVIQSATGGLQWSPREQDMKLIFIAGNEPFTQGDVDYHQSVKGAVAKGIVVTTIFCGSEAEGASTGWKEGALLGGGRYLCIDQNQAVAAITAPQDDEIIKLGAELNKTYVAYGKKGQEGAARQMAQDTNAATVNAEVNAQRAMAKASSAYRNTGWDLVDAETSGAVKVEEMKTEDLPENMQKMTPAERKAYVEKMKTRRAEIQAKIRQLQAERDKYVAEERKKQSGADTLDSAILKAVHEVAGKRGFQ